MSFLVDGGTYRRPRFATLEEARACANKHLVKTGEVLGVYEDSRPANATFEVNN